MYASKLQYKSGRLNILNGFHACEVDEIALYILELRFSPTTYFPLA